MLHRNKHPYRSSTLYHVICSWVDDSDNLNLNEKVEKGRKFIFDFTYPTPEKISEKKFKDIFERMFIHKYINDYFAYETFEEFQLKLYSKLNEVMPIYNLKLNLLYSNSDDLLYNIREVTEEINKKSDTSRNTDNKSTTKNLDSNLPVNLRNSGSNIDNVKFANNGQISENTTDNKEINKNINNEIRNLKEKNGKLIESYQTLCNTVNNIYSDLLNEFQFLFSILM